MIVSMLLAFSMVFMPRPVTITPAEHALPLAPNELPRAGECKAITNSVGGWFTVSRVVVDRDSVIVTIRAPGAGRVPADSHYLFARIDDAPSTYVRAPRDGEPFPVGFGDLRPGQHEVAVGFLPEPGQAGTPLFTAFCVTIGNDRRANWPVPTPPPQR
jgi:hypothetical protein